jgi:acyl-coenzyme A synthetase/AMP-(fatty) acid ligase
LLSASSIAEPVAMSHFPPPFPQTILDALARAGGRPVFEHGRHIVTGFETLAMIRAAASGLRAIGFRTGDAIALLPGVLPEGFAVMLAAFTLGLRVSAVRPGLTPMQFAHLVAEGNDAIVADPRAAAREMLAVKGGTPLHTVDELIAYPDDGVALVPAGNLDDVARILYTSGSTGAPKGVAATYRTMREDWSIRPDRWTPAIADFAERMRRVLLFGTLASPVVLNHVMLALFTGGVAVIPDVVPQPLFPDVVERYRITGSIMTVPRLYRMLDSLGERAVDLRSLRALMVSGSPLNPRRYAAALAQLGPVVFQMYGQIEAGAFTLLTPAEIEARASRC